VWALDIAPDARTLVTGAADGGIRMWDLEAGQPAGGFGIHDGTGECVCKVACAPHLPSLPY
jgi:WD40 repeat protein